MKKILVFNLTRLGDLLQSTPALSGLKKKYPDVHISLLANKTFSGITNYLPFIDRVHIFDIKKFEPAFSGKPISIVEVYRYIESLLEEMKKERFDMVVNVTHSKFSAMFSHLLGAPEVIGLEATDFGDRQIKGLWINYFCNMVFNREYNRFNLVDLYTKGAGCYPDGKKLYITLTEDIKKHTNNFIEENNIRDSDLIVGFQPGSSRTDRRWPVKSFVRLSDELQSTLHAKIVLFGTSAEKDIGNELTSLAGKTVINAIGKTDIPQLIGMLRRVNILVTNDTGTMHIASALGVRIVALFFSHAWCYETGPYGEEHVILQADVPCAPCSHSVECKDIACRECITPEDVHEVIKMIRMDNKNIKKHMNRDINHFKKVMVMTPVFDHSGMCDFLPLKKYYPKDRDVIGMIYREVWKLLLDNTPPLDVLAVEKEKYVESIACYVSDRISKYFLTDSMISLFDSMKHSIESFKKLSEISMEGITHSEKLIAEYGRPQKDIGLIKEIGNKLSLTDEQIEQMEMTGNALRPMIQIFKFGKENMEGEDISILAKEIKTLYQRLYLGSYIVYKVLRGLAEINLTFRISSSGHL